MNIRRGLFRLWLVLTVIWTAIVVAVGSNSVLNPYVHESIYAFPVGEDEPDGFSKYSREAEMFAANAKKDEGTLEAIELGDTGALLYANRNKSTEEKRRLSEVAYNAYQQATFHARLSALGVVAALAFVPSITVSALFWAFMGFTRKR